MTWALTECSQIPGVAPMGRYTIQARGFLSEESEDVDLACYDVKLQLLPIRPHFGIPKLRNT